MREGLAIEIDRSLPAERVVRVLEQVVAWRGQPQAIRLDKGRDSLSECFITCYAERAIKLRYIQPGKPDQDAFIERYNSTYRTEVLNAWGFLANLAVHMLEPFKKEKIVLRARM